MPMFLNVKMEVNNFVWWGLILLHSVMSGAKNIHIPREKWQHHSAIWLSMCTRTYIRTKHCRIYKLDRDISVN